jgi:hypothetical protein
MDRAGVERWVAGYEAAWRSPGTARLADLFTSDASYLPSPWATPIVGLDALATFWDAERDSPNESFDLHREIVALDGATAVVRVAVTYLDPPGEQWRDLWIITFTPEALCSAFEEWPFTPTQPDGH